MSGQPIPLIRFEIEGQAFALKLDVVERVVRAVELSPLPGSPSVIRGIFNLGGRIVPVADPRRRLGLAEREIELEDCIVIARTPHRLLGILAHGDAEVTECGAEDVVRPEAVMGGPTAIEGIGRLRDGLVLIQDVSTFLSMSEERQIDEALRAAN